MTRAMHVWTRASSTFRSYLFSEQLLDGMNAEQFSRIKLRQLLEIRSWPVNTWNILRLILLPMVRSTLCRRRFYGWVNDLSRSPFNLAEGPSGAAAIQL